MPTKVLYCTVLLSLIVAACNSEPKPNAKTTVGETQFVRDTVEIKEHDTVAIGNYTLHVTPADSTGIPDFNEQHGIKISGGQTGYFTQYNDGIGLHLENGDTLQLKSDAAKVEEYHFYALLPSINHYLVRVQYPEGYSFLLVNRTNGTKVPLVGWPYLSPSRKFIMAVNVDLIAGHSANALQFLQADNKAFQSAYILDLKGWGAEKLKWLSDTSFIIEKRTPLIDTARGKIEFRKTYALVQLKSAKPQAF